MEACNLNRLNNIKTIGHDYNAVDRPGYDEFGKPIPYDKMHKLLERLIAPRVITLKVAVASSFLETC